MQRTRWLLPTVLLTLLAASPLRAEEPPKNPPKGGADKPAAPGAPGADAEPSDEADGPVPFVEEVNKAIDMGVVWLKAKPRLFPLEGGTAAHWGLIDGERNYGGGEGAEYRHPAGPTALALYALLKCGVDPKDPVIAEGFHWLRVEHDITEENDGFDRPVSRWRHVQAGSSYELSAMILALTARYDHYKRTKNSAEGVRQGKLKIGDKADLAWLHELVQALVERRGQSQPSPDPKGMLGWRYNQPSLTLQPTKGGQGIVRTVNLPPHANQDLSSTQLAALALYSAHRFGVKVEPQVWWDVLEFALSHQEADGPEHVRHDPVYTSGGYAAPKDKARGFMYLKGSPDHSEGKATGSMTACGLATILICKEVLCETEKGRKQFLERKLDGAVEKATWDALAWLDRNWSPFANPHSQAGYPIYYLYSLERAMDILGKNLVGKHNWYVEGGRQILDAKKVAEVTERLKKGTRKTDSYYWKTGSGHEPKDVLDTCFALLFLKRATAGLIPKGAVTGGDGAPADNR